MSRLKNKKPNVPKANLEDYFVLVSGTPKVGKTSMFVELIDKYFGDINKAMLIAFESGYKASKVIAEDVEDWPDFVDIVDELVEEKDNLPYEYLGLDTADVMYRMAVKEVIKEWNMKNPQKRTTDIGGVGAKGKSDEGYGVGYDKAKEKVWTQLDRLRKAGYGLFVITHSKDKEITQRDGNKFDQLVVSLPGSARDVFVNEADFIVFITSEKEKHGSEVINKRYMYFRTDGYVEAGGRFTNVPERIEYSVDGFLDVFKNAIESEFGDVKDIEKVKKEQQKEKEEKSKEYVEKEKAKKTANQLVKEITAEIKTLSQEKKDDAKNKIVEVIGRPDYRQVDDVNMLEECLTKIKEVNADE